MTPQQLKAMKLALEALKLLTGAWQTFGALDYGDNAIAAIKEVLAEHAMQEVQRLGQEIEQEPVACRPRLERVKGNDFEEWRKNISPELYAAGDAVLCWVNEGDLCMPPPQRKPLTNGEIYTEYITATNQTLRATDERLAFAFARAIEAAHGIKDNT